MAFIVLRGMAFNTAGMPEKTITFYALHDDEEGAAFKGMAEHLRADGHEVSAFWRQDEDERDIYELTINDVVFEIETEYVDEPFFNVEYYTDRSMI